MINHARLREDLKLFNVSLKAFRDVVERAVAYQSSEYMPKLPQFASEETLLQIKIDAEDDILNFSWAKIQDLSAEYEVACDIYNQSIKEDKTNWELQETKRISSTSIRKL